MDISGYTNEQTLVADVVKEFKARGSFDQLRKEVYSEIINQRSFQNLNKSIDEFVSSNLADRHNVNLRKNDMRDMIRRRLYEHNSFNNQINYLIAQTLDQKKSTCLRPIIENTCDSLCKPSQSTTPASSQPVDISIVKQEAPITPEPNKTSVIVPMASAHTPHKQKVTVEDFLISNEAGSKLTSSILPTATSNHHSPPKLEKSKSNTDLDKQLHQQKSIPSSSSKKDDNQTIVKQLSKSEDKSGSKQLEATKQQVSTGLKTSSTASPHAVIKKKETTVTTTSQSVPTTSDLIRRRLSITINETNLEVDPTNEYNFDWKLNQIDAHLLDDVSVSSVNTSDLTDLEELTGQTLKTDD